MSRPIENDQARVSTSARALVMGDVDLVPAFGHAQPEPPVLYPQTDAALLMTSRHREGARRGLPVPARRQRAGPRCMAGNHDLIALGRLGDRRCIPLARASLRWTRSVLADDARSALAALPATARHGGADRGVPRAPVRPGGVPRGAARARPASGLLPSPAVALARRRFGGQPARPPHAIPPTRGKRPPLRRVQTAVGAAVSASNACRRYQS
jgi:hypothetical protein